MKIQSQIAKTTFGKRKLDPEVFAAQQAKAKRTTAQGVVFGRRKLDGPAAKAAEPPAAVEPDAEPEVQEAGEPSRNPFIPAGDDDAPGYVTVKELEAKLAADPSLLKKAFEAEFRDGEPRKGAIRAMLAVAEAAPEPDARLIQVLKGHV